MAIPSADGATPQGFDAPGPGFDDPGFESGHSITVPKRREAWTYYVSPSELHCVKGHIVCRLKKAWHIPGMNGNGRNDRLGKGFGTALVTDAGAIRVPHRGLATTVFGKPYQGPQSNYLRKVESARHGHHYCEAWSVPRLLGAHTVWDFDHDGWLQFQIDATKLAIPGELDPAQVELATRGLFATIREVSMRDDNRAAIHLTSLLVHVPREHAPADILALLPDETGDKPTTSRRGPKK